MSQEARERWAQKKCPFGVGDESGMCCTSACAAWTEFDTRSNHVHEEVRWEPDTPGWFSGWKVEGRMREKEHKEIDEDGKEHWTKAHTVYKWVRRTTSQSGSCGGYCRRLATA
jgi:hypothetical protein